MLKTVECSTKNHSCHLQGCIWKPYIEHAVDGEPDLMMMMMMIDEAENRATAYPT